MTKKAKQPRSIGLAPMRIAAVTKYRFITIRPRALEISFPMAASREVVPKHVEKALHGRCSHIYGSLADR
jgi:hypothetical protein